MKHSKLNLLLALLITCTLSCKKEIQDNKESSESRNQSIPTLNNLDEQERFAVTKAIMLNESFKENSIGKTGSSYTLDSALYYLDVALNYEFGDIRTYRFVHDRFTYNLPLNEIPMTVDENTMNDWYDEISEFVESSYTSVNDARKKIYAVYIDKLESDENDYISISIVIGRNSYNSSDIEEIRSTPFSLWLNKTGNARFNYNGGGCGQWNDDGTPYDAQDYPGAKARGPVVDIQHGKTYGWDNGAAKQLEIGLNSTVTYTRFLAAGGSFPAVTTGNKIIKIGHNFKRSETMFPWDYPISQIQNIAYINHNPTQIFSFTTWSNTLSRQLPCLTYDMLNHYLNQSYAITLSKSNSITYTSGYTYDETWVIPEFRRQDIIQNPLPSQWRIQSNPLTWNNNDYYEYFRHEYTIREAKYVSVADPNQQ
jgi:hypothetical protein